ncbi:ProQ/FINO family protein [Halomonas nitroreducens]|uniref:ABC transporter substrate-binding protein n=1 Tax=Halomonas nitroreducens TaxID=447425 RepID=A0A431V957_9GAMM|nr:ProQ/FINO family protein [Halomonas nitroreducens]RTR07213.1 ABC transporter substrate-binding protein [Halomonas nitroreducens]
MIEERPFRLMAALEGRADALLGALRDSRVQQDALRSRLTELEQRRVSLEAHNAQLAAEVREEAAQRQALASRLEALERRLADTEAARLELEEENRELDEQNRELEGHNHRLQERLASGAPAPVFQRPGRQARGLSALIGHHRASPASSDEHHDTPDAPTPPAEAAATDVGAPAATPQADLPIGEAPSPQALLRQWYRRYDAAFFKGHTRPLKVGIHEDLAALEPWPEKLVRRALACYVNLPRYLKSVREGAERIDLAGHPAGQVDAGAAEHAHKKLERLQADRPPKGKPGKPRATKRRSRARQETQASGAAAEPAARPEPAPPAPTAPATDEPDDSRLQRKLGELLARHNAR